MPRAARRRHHTSERRRRAVPKRAPRKFRSANANPADRAPGLAPATYLTFPLFELPAHHRAAAEGDPQLARFLLAAIEAGAADAGKWKGDPERLALDVFNAWGEEFGDQDLSFSLEWVMSTKPDPHGSGYYSDAVPGDPDKVYLLLQPQSHAGLSIKQGMARLAEIDERLPSSLWSRLAVALFRCGLDVWDHHKAKEEEEFGWLGDMADELEADSGDGSSYRPSAVIPKYLEIESLGTASLRGVLASRKVRRGSWAGDLLYGALDLEPLFEGLPYWLADFTEEEQQNLYVDDMGQLPSLVVWFDEDDAMTHAWDMLGDSLNQGGGPFSPAATFAVDLTPDGIRSLRDRLARIYGVMVLASKLIELLRYPDGVPLAVQLEQVEARERVRVRV